jgi:hypothetical protein
MSPFDWAAVDIKHGPRGFRQKKLQNLDSMNRRRRMKIVDSRLLCLTNGENFSTALTISPSSQELLNDATISEESNE